MTMIKFVLITLCAVMTGCLPSAPLLTQFCQLDGVPLEGRLLRTVAIIESSSSGSFLASSCCPKVIIGLEFEGRIEADVEFHKLSQIRQSEWPFVATIEVDMVGELKPRKKGQPRFLIVNRINSVQLVDTSRNWSAEKVKEYAAKLKALERSGYNAEQVEAFARGPNVAELLCTADGSEKNGDAHK